VKIFTYSTIPLKEAMVVAHFNAPA